MSYQVIKNNNFVVPATVSAVTMGNTPGVRIMAKVQRKNLRLDTAAEKILKIFHQEMQNLWTWDPTGASAFGGPLLDGQTMRGECKQLATAFYALLKTPAPYGFGMSSLDEQNNVVTWPPSQSGKSFISQHDQEYFGCKANVLKPNWQSLVGDNRFQPLRGWGDHKVVAVPLLGTTLYFDPCYNKVYLLIEEMAEYVIEGTDFNFVNKVAVVYSRARHRIGERVRFKNVGGDTPQALTIGALYIGPLSE